MLTSLLATLAVQSGFSWTTISKLAFPALVKLDLCVHVKYIHTCSASYDLWFRCGWKGDQIFLSLVQRWAGKIVPRRSGWKVAAGGCSSQSLINVLQRHPQMDFLQPPALISCCIWLPWGGRHYGFWIIGAWSLALKAKLSGAFKAKPEGSVWGGAAALGQCFQHGPREMLPPQNANTQIAAKRSQS